MDDKPAKTNPTGPNFATFDELVAPARSFKKVRLALGIIGLMAFLLIGREAGLPDFYCFHLSAQTHAHLILNENGFHMNGDTPSQTNHQADFDWDDTSWNWGTRLPGLRWPTLATGLDTAIAEKLQNKPGIKVEVKSAELDGPFWLPVYKHGTCSYRMAIWVVNEDQISFSGEVSGKMDFNLVGTSSIRMLKDALAENIANHAFKSATETAAKTRRQR